MKKNIGSKLALYPMPITVIGAMNGDKPTWWGEAPRIMSTFIESYDFSGKTLAAFCTSASSGFGSSDSTLRSAASGAQWLNGERFSADASADEIISWANGLGI